MPTRHKGSHCKTVLVLEKNTNKSYHWQKYTKKSFKKTQSNNRQ